MRALSPDLSMTILRACLQRDRVDMVAQFVERGLIPSGFWRTLSPEDASWAARVGTKHAVRTLHDYGVPRSSLSDVVDGRSVGSPPVILEADKEFIERLGPVGMAVLTRDGERLERELRGAVGSERADHALRLAGCRDYCEEVVIACQRASTPVVWEAVSLACPGRSQPCMQALLAECRNRGRVLCATQHNALRLLLRHATFDQVAIAVRCTDGRVLSRTNGSGRRPIDYAFARSDLTTLLAPEKQDRVVRVLCASDCPDVEVMSVLSGDSAAAQGTVLHTCAARGWISVFERLPVELMWRMWGDLGPGVLSAARHGHRGIAERALWGVTDEMLTSRTGAICAVAMLEAEWPDLAMKIVSRCERLFDQSDWAHECVSRMTQSGAAVDVRSAGVRRVYNDWIARAGYESTMELACGDLYCELLPYLATLVEAEQRKESSDDGVERAES